MLQILEAKLKDIDLISPLFDLYRQFYKQSSDLQAAKLFLQARIQTNESVIFFARDANQALGFIQLYPSFSSISMKRLWILNDLFVKAEARRNSLGRRLVEAATEYAAATNAKGLTLKTSVDNLPAQSMYESMGWKRNERFYTYDFTAKLVA